MSTRVLKKIMLNYSIGRIFVKLQEVCEKNKLRKECESLSALLLYGRFLYRAASWFFWKFEIFFIFPKIRVILIFKNSNFYDFFWTFWFFLKNWLFPEIEFVLRFSFKKIEYFEKLDFLQKIKNCLGYVYEKLRLKTKTS